MPFKLRAKKRGRHLTQISQGTQTRTYVYDDAGRKTSETTPEAGTVSYTYNSDNLMTTRTDDARGVVTTYSYDSALNRLTSISYNVSCCSSTVPSTPTVSYTYGTSVASNNNGRLITMTDGLGEETYSYDSLGRTTQVAKKIYNVTYTTSYTYNLAGGVVNTTYPSGRVVKHEYDNIGRLKNVKNNASGASYVSNAAYNTASQLTGYTYGNNVVASYGYSANRLQLTSISYTKSGATHLSLSYGYSQSGNNNGQIVSITDNQQSGRTVSYTYDSLHRLKTALTNGSAGYPQWGLSWSYDRYGNRTAQSVTHGSGPSSSPTISATTNRITALGGYTYYYDSNGSLTQDDLFKYKYDAENRLVEIRNLSNTLLASYAYDGNGMQVIKVVGAWRQWFIYAGAQLVSEYTDAASATYTSPTSPGSAPSDSLSTVLYQHSDHLTTRATTENDGDLSNAQAHYPYGEKWYEDGTANPSVKRKFTSYRKETDGSLATGQINYAIARYHGARTGRFHRPDPVQGGSPQRLNRYGYTRGDPVNRFDPSGLDDSMGSNGPDPEPCGGGICIAMDIGNWGSLGSSDGEGEVVGNGFNACVNFNTTPPAWIGAPVSVYPAAPGWPSIPLGCALPQSQSGQGCFAQLKYRDVRGSRFAAGLECTHAFWFIKGRQGYFTISGGPTGSVFFGGGGNLDVWVNRGRDGGARFPDDKESAQTAWQTPVVSHANCDAVDDLLYAAQDWRANRPYGGTRGPNSNTAARVLGREAGFVGVTQPPRSCGWEFPY